MHSPPTVDGRPQTRPGDYCSKHYPAGGANDMEDEILMALNGIESAISGIHDAIQAAIKES